MIRFATTRDILRHKYINTYRQIYNISRIVVGNKIVDYSDVVGASPVGAVPTTPSFPTLHLVSIDWAQKTARRDENHVESWDLVRLILDILR